MTPRQREVVALLVAGLTNKEIANRLSITEGTVKNHLTNVRHQLGLDGTNRVEFAFRVMQR